MPRQHQIAVERRRRATIDFRHAIRTDPLNVVRFADHHAAQGIAMAVDVFGDAVQHDICAQLQHMLYRGRRKSSVYNDPDLISRQVFDCPNICDLHHRIIGGLKIDHLGVGADGSLYCLQITGIHA